MWTFFFLIFYFPTAQKLKSKAQSLPHVYPSTSVCLSLRLGYLGDSFSEDNRSFHSLEILNPSLQKWTKLQIEKMGRMLLGAGYNHVSFHGTTMIGFPYWFPHQRNVWRVENQSSEDSWEQCATRLHNRKYFSQIEDKFSRKTSLLLFLEGKKNKKLIFSSPSLMSQKHPTQRNKM